MSTPMADTHVIARKAHRCDLCGYTITPGTRHRVYSVASDGSASRFREHILCTRHAGEDEEWYALDPDGPYMGLLHALADLDDAWAAERCDVPALPGALDWQPCDNGRWTATWWRYRVIRRETTRGAIVHVTRNGRDVASVYHGLVLGARSAPARRFALCAAGLWCPGVKTRAA